jgi:hypothetical protein
MAKTERFNLGFLQLDTSREEVFLSVTPGFEHGPGIQRDGITSPRMTDPHSVPKIRNSFQLGQIEKPEPTTDAYVQRAGTWTIYHHIKQFMKERGAEWTVVAVQSNGDLTMNPWHVAYIGAPDTTHQTRGLCALLTDRDPQEPVASRIYRSLVKWRDDAATARKRSFECLNLRIEAAPQGRALKINDPDIAARYSQHFKHLKDYNATTGDIAPLVAFTLSGKPIVEDGVELSLANAIDRFEDIRHVFNLPTVPAKGFLRGQQVDKLNFGEYQLFANLNERRAALFSPVLIDLDIDGRVSVDWDDVASTLRRRHFKESSESPTRRGQFRRYRDQADRDKVEIFFPYNVYPFGVLGIQEPQGDERGGLVCLSSGGLSGRVGNTLEGTARIMFDFFGCSDAMVLDEGYDVFFISNPVASKAEYIYSNEELLAKVLAFAKERVDRDHEDSLKTASSYIFSGGMKNFPLNTNLLKEVDDDFASSGQKDYSDVLLVSPQRSQMRSVLIFATRKR